MERSASSPGPLAADNTPTELDACPIVTFYSYKGGVGRSMAVANLAVLLARDRKKDVLMVDWDLEAPGLHRFFGVSENSLRSGVIDYFDRYKREMAAPTGRLTPDVLDIEPAIITCKEYRDGGRVRLLAAGSLRAWESYSDLVNHFDWDDFYRNWNGAHFVENLRNRLKRACDIVLIDSRTGITDIGGVCTLHLPDVVVFVFTFNRQNLAGIERVARTLKDGGPIGEKLGRRPKLLLLPSRKELSELDLLSEWKDMTVELLGPLVRPTSWLSPDFTNLKDYISDSAIQYIPYFAYGEGLAANTDKGRELVKQYEVFLSVLDRVVPGGIQHSARGRTPWFRWLARRIWFAEAHDASMSRVVVSVGGLVLLLLAFVSQINPVSSTAAEVDLDVYALHLVAASQTTFRLQADTITVLGAQTLEFNRQIRAAEGFRLTPDTADQAPTQIEVLLAEGDALGIARFSQGQYRIELFGTNGSTRVLPAPRVTIGTLPFDPSGTSPFTPITIRGRVTIGAAGRVALDTSVLSVSHLDFSQFDVSSSTFQTSSTIKLGSITFPTTQVLILPGEAVSFERAVGDVRLVGRGGDTVSVAFRGELSGTRIRSDALRRNVQPTRLSVLVDQWLGLIWSTLTALAIVFLSLLAPWIRQLVRMLTPRRGKRWKRSHS